MVGWLAEGAIASRWAALQTSTSAARALHPVRTYVRMPASDRPQVNRQAHMETETRRVVVRRRSHAARIYPTPAQAAVLHRQGHTARALWNLLHNWYTCRNGGIAKRPSTAEIDRQLRGARTDPLPSWEWLADLPCQATQQVLKHYLRAWDQFYKGLARPPRLRKRSARLAVDVPQASKLCVARLTRRWGEVTIPLVGRVRFRWTRPLPGVSRGCPGRITGARLIKNPLGWCISFRIEEATLEVPANPYPPVGVDRGIAHAMALSDGQYLDMPPLFRERELRRLRKLELQAARRRAIRKPGAAISNRERSTYEHIAALRARQARREDWLHNKTTKLATNHSLVVIEDLAIKNMTRSARGTVDRPGRRVRVKAGLTARFSAWHGARPGACSPTNVRCMAASWSRFLLHIRPRRVPTAAMSPGKTVAGPAFAAWRAGTRRRRIPMRRRCFCNVDLPPKAAPPQGMGWLDVEPWPLGGP
jgi:putative transposase